MTGGIVLRLLGWINVIDQSTNLWQIVEGEDLIFSKPCCAVYTLETMTNRWQTDRLRDKMHLVHFISTRPKDETHTCAFHPYKANRQNAYLCISSLQHHLDPGGYLSIMTLIARQDYFHSTSTEMLDGSFFHEGLNGYQRWQWCHIYNRNF